MHRRREQQRRDRRPLLVGVAIGEHEDPLALGDRARRLGAHAVERVLQRGPTPGHLEQAGDDLGGELGPVAVAVDVDQLGELVVVDDRERQLDLHARLRPRIEQVAFRADGARQRRDQLFADGVERRVGDLGEELLEVVEQQARTVREHGDRRVGAHRADGLGTVLRHRRHEQLELLVGVAERLLAPQHRLVAVHDVDAVGQRVQVHQPLVEPLAVRDARRRGRP